MSASDALNKFIGKRDEPGGGKQDKMDAREPVRGKLIPPAYDFGYGATWLSAATHKLLCPGSAPQNSKTLPLGSWLSAEGFFHSSQQAEEVLCFHV